MTIRSRIFNICECTRSLIDSIKPDFYPQLEQFQADKKVELTGITESTATDTTHETLARAVDDGLWDVVMG